MSENTFDPHRRLCPDGSCIGVIGPDGRCGACGRTADGRPRVLAGGVAEETASGGAGDADEPDRGVEAAAAEPAEAGGGFDVNRRLCEDGSCVGVIGPSGRCNVCGQQAT
jgi:hypothetical protein